KGNAITFFNFSANHADIHHNAYIRIIVRIKNQSF
ncbi:hypothetical protein CP8484711_1001, partial [Chlamydia psittaci 84-8471/1]